VVAYTEVTLAFGGALARSRFRRVNGSPNVNSSVGHPPDGVAESLEEVQAILDHAGGPR
jgi:hypothetical protein